MRKFLMNKTLLMMIGLGLFVALPSPRLHAQVAGSVRLNGHVPELVKHLQSTGHLAATNMDLAIGLPLRNTEWLTNLLGQINDPASTNYHKYLTPSQFADQFGPTEKDYEAVASFAAQNNLKVTRTHSNRLLLDVSGLSTDIEKAFQVNFKTYHHPTEGRDFFATDVEPSVPAGLPVIDISGLGNLSRPLNDLKTVPLPALTNSAVIVKPSNGSGPGGLYMGNDFRNAYAPGAVLNGSGQSVALVQFDGYFPSDIQEYEGFAGRTNIPLQNILLDGYTGQAGPNQDEVCLDIEMVMSMAPALAKILVYEGNPNNFFPNDVLNQIATDDAAHQVSSSWIWTGLPTGTTEQILEQMALQGQTFCEASGDYDAYPAGTTVFTPSDSPFVTSVGGTTLVMTAGGGSRVSETVWNYDIYGLDGEGSSGGISTSYNIPSWQTNINMTLSKGSTVFRNFPDVALTGDGVFVVTFGGLEEGAAGTSCAAPLWAGFTALINQQETNYNRAPIGFLNPSLYALASLTNYASDFNDLTAGSNTWSGSPNLFYAVTNYDLCSGLGTPNGTNLINALAPLNSSTNGVYTFQLSAPQQPYGTMMAAMNGGSPNGLWTLFIEDESHFNTGMIANGWSVTLTLGNPVGAVADLDVTMTNYVSLVAPGSNVVFYIGVTNYGVSTATNVIIEDSLPVGSAFVSGIVSTGSIVQGGTEVTWAVSNLVAGAGASLALTLQAPTVAGSMINYAVAQSDTPIVNTADNSATATVTVGVAAAPQLSGIYTATNGAFTLNINGSSTGPTIIYASTNLTTWDPVYTNSSPFVSPFTFTDPNMSKNKYRFFQAVTEP
jgi:uncharacterized repeat protein (TIGR01451 family)